MEALVLVFLLPALAFLIGLWITYMVLKASIREGIKESGLLEVLEMRQARQHEHSGPPIHAER